jgi:hypothetical protein
MEPAIEIVFVSSGINEYDARPRNRAARKRITKTWLERIGEMLGAGFTVCSAQLTLTTLAPARKPFVVRKARRR